MQTPLDLQFQTRVGLSARLKPGDVADRARQGVSDRQSGCDSSKRWRRAPAAWRFGTWRVARAAKADRPSHRAHAGKRRAAAARAGGRRYVPGPRLVRLGLESSRPQCRARRATQFSNRYLRKSARPAISASWRAAMLFISIVSKSAWPFGLRFEPGSRVPLHCTSMGKLFLSRLPVAKRASLLPPIAALSIHREHHYRHRTA